MCRYPVLIQMGLDLTSDLLMIEEVCRKILLLLIRLLNDLLVLKKLLPDLGFYRVLSRL